MAKKKQPDFQPTKLRVGRHLPKGRNVTNTAFKSKKIITKDQRLKASEDKSLPDLIRLTHNVNVATKTDALRRIAKYMTSNADTLPAYFSEILKATGKLFLDLHPRVRKEAVNVIKVAADILSSDQMGAFTSVLTSHLNCMMTRFNLSVKIDSLKLLSYLLKTHPGSMVGSTKCLSYLLNMISSVKVHKGDSSMSHKKRKLDDNISTTMTSVEWRDQVLKIIAEFLEKLVETYANQKQPCEDEQKVYYDGAEPLFVQLYAGGGLAPAKLDFPSNQKKSKGRVTGELRKFFSEILSVASDIVTEEVAGSSVSSGCKILRPDNVDHLNTVTEVLCHIADWYNMDSQTEDRSLILEMNEILSKKLMKGFRYKMQESKKRRNREMSCVYLNLGISSLYCFFCLGRVFESVAAKREILLLVMAVVNQEQYQDVKTTSFILKILKCFFRVLANSDGDAQDMYREEFTAIMAHLCDMASRYRDRDLTEAIQSFFIELSLDYEYKFLLNGEVLDAWICYAFNLMKEMHAEKKADKSMLKCITLMCSREYTAFMEQLKEANPTEILNFLTLDDEDYQSTVMNLITHKTNLPANFLQTVARFILQQLHYDRQVSERTLVRLIRSLYHRFSDKRVSQAALYEFCRFILNVAFDVVSVEKAVDRYKVGYGQYTDNNDQQLIQEDYPVELMHLLHNVQSRFQQFIVVPSQQWERHSKICEVCIECLILCHDRGLAKIVINNFYFQLLKSLRILPVHSVISLLKIATNACWLDQYSRPSEQLATFIGKITVCGLLYISICTNKQSPMQCKEMSVGDLQSALKLNNNTAYHALQTMVGMLFDQDSMQNLVLHSLRVIIFLASKNLLNLKNMGGFDQVVRIVEMYFNDDSLERAYLCKIYEFL